jgi:hypothetical protein
MKLTSAMMSLWRCPWSALLLLLLLLLALLLVELEVGREMLDRRLCGEMLCRWGRCVRDYRRRRGRRACSGWRGRRGGVLLCGRIGVTLWCEDLVCGG